MGRQPRQRPISCHFCRVRKLRCSRDFPCTNCLGRGLQCQTQDPPRAVAPARRPAAKRTTGGGSTSTERESDILSRLERLESLLAERNKQPENEAHASSSVSQSSLEENHASPRPQQVDSQQALPLNVQNLTADALWLERTCLGPKPSESVLVDNIVFRTCPIRMITQSSCYVFQNSNFPSNSISLEPTRCIWLPNREETGILIDKYTSIITYMHHIVHIPSLRNLADEVYDTIEQGTQVPLCSAFLILSICANVTYAWTSTDNDTAPLFADFSESNTQSLSWLKAAMDVFDICQRSAHIALESVQGLIVLGFVLFNVEGISIRARGSLFQAITICRELGLHRLDHPHNSNSGQSSRLTGVKAEVARRVWWYLVGMDTLLARFPGPHEGTYLINPSHIAVRKPLNANDEDLVDGEEMVGRPLTEPTSMSYALQRVRLAELTREFTDRIPLTAGSETITYDFILELDATIDRFIKEIPPFLTMGADELKRLPPTDPRRSLAISIQRHIMKIFVHGQRCKIHLPYLARGAVEPTYAHSRNVCLEAARIIIHAEHDLDEENTVFTQTHLILTLVLHSVFLATIVLFLDFCLGGGAQEKEVRRQDLTKAWTILERAKEFSKPTARIQDLLRQVMKKHEVSLPLDKEMEQRPARTAGKETGLPPTPSSATAFSAGPADNGLSGQGLEELGLTMELDGMDWDSLLWGLDAPLI
ncbi:hypothetical protein FZEAL_3853 [Fusarium zealandicum]|uniref:Zn(2)-C6 fungal-type domain-containing protein n=1 Tax=Fusarium zealandicum TaxID=1053134 RepID=A0A8H4UN16_9HYPO|nr:hypothetical protein FZEAL_3853 [Fusarium zealandicum]